MTIADRRTLDRLSSEEDVSRLGRCLDERDFEGLRELFTADATVTTPGGTATGHDALVAQARSRHSRDDGIQHVITNVMLDGDGDEVAVRANLLVSFAATGPADAAPFLLGEVYRFGFRRTGVGWRITTLSSTPVWTLNRPVGATGIEPVTARV
jgi:hypothetical protein